MKCFHRNSIVIDQTNQEDIYLPFIKIYLIVELKSQRSLLCPGYPGFKTIGLPSKQSLIILQEKTIKVVFTYFLLIRLSFLCVRK